MTAEEIVTNRRNERKLEGSLKVFTMHTACMETEQWRFQDCEHYGGQNLIPFAFLFVLAHRKFGLGSGLFFFIVFFLSGLLFLF